VVKLQSGINILVLVVIAQCGASAQSQSATEMQQNMQAAAAVQSSANISSFRTPLETYQQYHNALTAGNVTNLLATFSEAGLQRKLGGQTLTADQLAAAQAAISQEAYTDHQVLSFIFQKPK
jgi:hypothetical protein